MKKTNIIGEVLVLKELIAKDIRFVFRLRFSFFTPIAFSLVSSLFISISLPPDFLKEHSFEILWIVFIFSSVFPSVDLMRYEGEGGVLEALLSSPIKKEIFFLSKFLVSFLLLVATILFLLLIFFVFANFSPSFPSVLALLLSAVGVSSLSTLFASFYIKDAVKIPAYIILFPLYIPLAISSSEVSHGNLSTFKLIFGFDILNFSLAFLLFDISFE